MAHLLQPRTPTLLRHERSGRFDYICDAAASHSTREMQASFERFAPWIGPPLPFFERFTPTTFLRGWAKRRATARLERIKAFSPSFRFDPAKTADIVIDRIMKDPETSGDNRFLREMSTHITGTVVAWPKPEDELLLVIRESSEIINHSRELITLGQQLAEEVARHISRVTVQNARTPTYGLELVQAALLAELVPRRLLMDAIARLRRTEVMPWRDGVASMDALSGRTFVNTGKDLDNNARAFRVVFFAVQVFALRISEKSLDARMAYGSPLLYNSAFWSECQWLHLEMLADSFDMNGALHKVSSVVHAADADDLVELLHAAALPEHAVEWFALLMHSLNAPAGSQLAEVARDMAFVLPPILWRTLYVMADGRADHLLAEHRLAVIRMDTPFDVAASGLVPLHLLPCVGGLMLLQSPAMFDTSEWRAS